MKKKGKKKFYILIYIIILIKELYMLKPWGIEKKIYNLLDPDWNYHIKRFSKSGSWKFLNEDVLPVFRKYAIDRIRL